MTSGAVQPRTGHEGGVALTEFALVSSLLFTLLFGIIEFGWVFFQYQDVRQGAREGARMAAVEESLLSDDLVVAICARMEDTDATSVELVSHGDDTGDPGDIIVRRRVDTLTGFLDPILGSFLDVDSTVRFRVEHTKKWQSIAPRDC